MRNALVCAAATAAIVGGLATAPAHAAPAPKSVTTNLIANGNAEAGTGSTDGGIVVVPAWTVPTDSQFTAVQYGASGGFPFPADPGPANRGANFFGGGPNPASGVSVATQARSLAAKLHSSIDAGTATFTLHGFLGGFSSQGDHATVSVAWQNGSGAALGSASIGPVTEAQRQGLTGLKPRTKTGTVPAGTRKILVTVTLTRDEGSYDDGYADNLSLTVTTPDAG